MRSDFAGKPQAMGRYSGQVLDARSLANDAALLVVRWSIDKDGKRMMGGVSTQLWKRIGGQWRIVLEHAS
jgi:ketosteroid isomerase-like protein